MTTTDWISWLIYMQSILLPVGAILFLALESWSFSGIAPPWRQRWRHDLSNWGLWLVVFLLFNYFLSTALLPIMPLMEMYRVGMLYFLGLPPWLHALLGFLLYDFAGYLFHRLSHEVRWLWLVHAVHHSDNAMDISTHVRAHPLHVLTAICFRVLVVAALGIPYWVILLNELLSLPVAQLHHSAVRWPNKWEQMLNKLIVTPPMHRLHHSSNPRYTDSNYGSLVPWWDFALGTYSQDEETHTSDRIPETGLATLSDPYWQGVVGMLLTPFAQRGRSML